MRRSARSTGRVHYRCRLASFIYCTIFNESYSAMQRSHNRFPITTDNTAVSIANRQGEGGVYWIVRNLWTLHACDLFNLTSTLG